MDFDQAGAKLQIVTKKSSETTNNLLNKPTSQVFKSGDNQSEPRSREKHKKVEQTTTVSINRLEDIYRVLLAWFELKVECWSWVRPKNRIRVDVLIAPLLKEDKFTIAGQQRFFSSLHDLTHGSRTQVRCCSKILMSPYNLECKWTSSWLPRSAYTCTLEVAIRLLSNC